MDIKSVQKAMEQLKAAKAEIEKLQKQKELAMENVKRARSSADTAQSKTNDKVVYSDKSYWEGRYVDASKTHEDELYEWYIDFQALKEYIIEDLQLSNSYKPMILVSGCGNSTFCEELAESGISDKVYGMDYSPAVIDMMQARVETKGYKGVHYFQADARMMPEVASGSYDCILDKGTLDAIASAGASERSGSNQSQAEDAANYMLECWRGLKVGGKMVLISTMPPDILEPVAMAPLLSSSSSSSATAIEKNKVSSPSVCNWKTGSIIRNITTPEGGQVYYYCITKLAHCTKLSSFNSSNTTRTAPTARTDTDKEDIMAGIAALLEEAKKAKSQLDLAVQKQTLAATDLQQTEARRESLEHSLAGDINHLHSGSTGDQGSLEEDQMIQNAIAAAVKLIAPVVKVFIDPEESQLVADGILSAYYILQANTTAAVGAAVALENGGWNEDDTINLVCSDKYFEENNAISDARLYKNGDQPYEVFEYTELPQRITITDNALLQRIGAHAYLSSTAKSSACWLGRAKLRLPTYAATYSVTYVRTVSLPAKAVTLTAASVSDATTAGKIVQRRVTLAQSSLCTVKTPVYGAHPDFRGVFPECILPSHSTAPSKGVKQLSNVRRRGAGAMVNSCLPLSTDSITTHLAMWCEDMPNIQALSISTQLICNAKTVSAGVKKILTRAMVWVVPVPDITVTATVLPEFNTVKSSATAGAQALQIIVEVDIIEIEITSEKTSAHTVRTIYGVLQVTDTVFAHAAIDLSRASAYIDERGVFMCRLPYQHITKPSTEVPVTNTERQFQALQTRLQHCKDSRSEVATSLSCRLCGAGILDASAMQDCRPLPSGLLDNMMHDFICCEEVPVDDLTSSDLATPLHTLLYGPQYLSLSPDHLVHTTVEVRCKTAVSRMDLLNSCGGTIATAPIPLPGLTDDIPTRWLKLKQCLKSMINIDACEIRCMRCTSYLGEAQLLGEGYCDPSCEVHPPAATTKSSSRTAAGTAPVATGTPGAPFSVADLRDVRLDPSAVSLRCHQQGTRLVDTMRIEVSSEQVLSASVTHMQAVYGVSSFVFYLADSDFRDMNAVESRAVVLKLVSRDYRTSVGASSREPISAEKVGGASENGIFTPPQIQAATTANSVTIPQQVVLRECIKVSYHIGNIVEVVTGTEARIPVQWHEFLQLTAVLEQRCTLLCASPFKGHKLSFLFA